MNIKFYDTRFGYKNKLSFMLFMIKKQWNKQNNVEKNKHKK